MLLNPSQKQLPFGEAQIRYEDGDYQILKNGTFVRCAISKKVIPLDELKYWSVAKQEAYLSPEEVLVSFRQNM